jgi:hypothetical protein
MPFMYDVKRAFTSSGTPGTEVTDIVGKTIANQQILAIYSLYLACRFLTAGGHIARMKTCTAAGATGGTAQTPAAKNGLNPAAQSTWVDSTTAITAGGTLVTRQSVGGASTGGNGGWQALFPADAVQMQPNNANPIDVEFSELGAVASVTGDITVEIGEGI